MSFSFLGHPANWDNKFQLTTGEELSHLPSIYVLEMTCYVIND